MTYGFCVYHGIECDYKGSCIDCPHNTEEDAEWFKQDEIKAESEDYNCMACAHDGDNNICNECENGSKYLKWRTVYWEQAGNPDRLERRDK